MCPSHNDIGELKARRSPELIMIEASIMAAINDKPVGDAANPLLNIAKVRQPTSSNKVAMLLVRDDCEFMQ
jgi:hypothetical protein